MHSFLTEDTPRTCYFHKEFHSEYLELATNEQNQRA